MRRKRETFFAIRRTDGETVDGEHIRCHADGPDDWTWPENTDHYDGPVEYEIIEMTVRSISKRTFGDLLDEDDE